LAVFLNEYLKYGGWIGYVMVGTVLIFSGLYFKE